MKSVIMCLLTSLCVVNVSIAQPRDFAGDIQQHSDAFSNLESKVLDFSKQLQCVMKLSDEELCYAAKHGFFWEVDCYLIEARCFTLCDTGEGQVHILTAVPHALVHFGFGRFAGPIEFKGILILPCEEQICLLKLICPDYVAAETTVVEKVETQQIPVQQVPVQQVPLQQQSPQEIPLSPGTNAPAPPVDAQDQQSLGRAFDDLN